MLLAEGKRPHLVIRELAWSLGGNVPSVAARHYSREPALPCVVVEGVGQPDADELVSRLTALGAEAEASTGTT